jgi:hypothetical protein
MQFDDPPPPDSAVSVQIGFRVAPKEVDDCARMRAARVPLISLRTPNALTSAILTAICWGICAEI